MDGENGRLFMTDPAGIVTEWRVMMGCWRDAIGKRECRNEGTLRSYLETHYKEGLSEEEGITLVLSCLLEVRDGVVSDA